MYKNKGMTLLEIIIVVSLFVIIIACVFNVLAKSRTSWNAGASQLNVQYEARRGIDAMVKELRQTGLPSIIDVPPDGASYNSITFKIPTAISIAGITWSDNVQYSRAGLNGKQLIRTQTGNQRVLANNISALSFMRSPSEPNAVNISITAQENAFPGFTAIQSSTTISSKVKVRN